MAASHNDPDEWINFCSAEAGARVLFATDEWFAAADRLLLDAPPVFDPHAYCAQGKVMDGWESRRRRAPGHDWCVVQLSCRAATLHRVEIDTAHFTGNHAPFISIDARDFGGDDITAEADFVTALPRATRRLLISQRRMHDKNTNDDDNTIDIFRGTGATPEEVAAADAACDDAWHEILPRQPLRPGYEERRHHVFSISASSTAATHIRLHLYPDGGVARLRLYGVPAANAIVRLPPQPLYMPIVTGPAGTVVSYDDAAATMPSQEVDAALVEVSCGAHGGTAVYGTNQHYGTPANLLQSSSGVDMGDGWETARQPQRPPILVANKGLVDFGALSESCVLRLGRPVAQVAKIILDTKHFKGNYPESVEVHGCYWVDDDDRDWNHADWFPLIPRIRLSPHAEHGFDAAQLRPVPAPGVSHVRVRIFPDGGLSRVRIYAAAIPKP